MTDSTVPVGGCVCLSQRGKVHRLREAGLQQAEELAAVQVVLRVVRALAVLQS